MLHVLTNKHFIISLIVAPILAVIAYFAVDYSVSEKPHQAVKGEAYPLVSKSNCRYKSGICTFENGDISVSVRSKIVGKTQLNLLLDSEIGLQGVKIALATTTGKEAPQDMHYLNQERTSWEVTIQHSDIAHAQLQLALLVDNSIYYGETPTIFTTYETGFSQSNIQ